MLIVMEVLLNEKNAKSRLCLPCVGNHSLLPPVIGRLEFNDPRGETLLKSKTDCRNLKSEKTGLGKIIQTILYASVKDFVVLVSSN